MTDNGHGGEAGVTLLELVAGIAIVGLIIVPIAVIINQFIFIPGQLSASVTLMNGSRQAVRWIAEDVRQSDSFVSSTSPDYGTLSWTDRTQSSITTHTVRYFFSSTGESLMREETLNGDSQTIRVADNIKPESTDGQGWTA